MKALKFLITALRSGWAFFRDKVSRQSRTEDCFNEIAGDYDAWITIDPDYEEHHQLVMDRVRREHRDIDQSRIEILEIGCGTGYTSQRILATDERVRLWAIDPSFEMVKIADTVLSQHYPRSRYFLSPENVLTLNPPPEFPIVVSVFMLHNIVPEKRGEAVRKMARALRSGGLLIIGDKIAHNDAEEHGRVMEHFWTMEAKLKDFGPAGRHDFWHAHNWEDEQMKMTETELATHLWAAGLEEISIGERCGIGMYAIATARKPL